MAINAGFNLMVVDDQGQHHVTTTVLRYLRAPDTAQLGLLCPPDFLNVQPKLVRIDAFFTNMANHVIRFVQSGRVAERVLQMTSAPEYVWPWD